MDQEQRARNNFVKFRINGIEHQVHEDDKLTPETKLVDFIRDHAGLKGTKYMCREGGCGACIVTAYIYDPVTKMKVPKAVNACLPSVFGCNGWDIFTVEHLGNQYEKKQHPILSRLVNFNATQCGYCTPGMAMSMYSLRKSKSEVKVEDVENMLDSNICRCTGYRPILDAFKSFATDSPKRLLNMLPDIEDYRGCPKIQNSELPISDSTSSSETSQNDPRYSNSVEVKIDARDGQWISANDLPSAYRAIDNFTIMNPNGNVNYRIVAGNTGHGVYRYEPVKYYLDINSIKELKEYSVNAEGITFGSCVTITTAIKVLRDASKMDGFKHTEQMSKHLQRVANTSVRNIGTLGGNLMLKKTHREFPSDVFLLLETVKANIIIGSPSRGQKIYSTLDFFDKVNMDGKLLISIRIPPLKGNYEFHSFKVGPRYENAEAYVNAGILMRIDPQGKTVMEKPYIVYGGISSTFVHANETEKFLQNKRLTSEQTLKEALRKLDIDVVPNSDDTRRPPAAYRILLTKSLLYKVILRIVGSRVNSQFKSGADIIVYKTSRGMQTFTDGTDTGPLYKATMKLEAPLQASGEAEYVNDIPQLPNELFGAFVLSTAIGNLDSIDTSEAMSIDGVVRFIRAQDIPGENNFYQIYKFPGANFPEQVFVADEVQYAGQAVGLIVATSRDVAFYAASKVVVKYKNVKPPFLSVKKAVKDAESNGTLDQHVAFAISLDGNSNENATHEIQGEFEMGSQYAFHMELQTCFCIPKDGSMDVHCATQWLDHCQAGLCAVLKLPTNYFNMEVKRLGGGFGAKFSRPTMLAASCALAAYLTRRPVRVTLDMETNMALMGWRPTYFSKYSAKFNDTGKIIELKVLAFGGNGCVANEPDASILLPLSIQNAYKAYGWDVKTGVFPTDIAAASLVRSPGNFNRTFFEKEKILMINRFLNDEDIGKGALQGIAIIEYIMEHIAFELKMDPLEVRAANYREENDTGLGSQQPVPLKNLIPEMVSQMKSKSQLEMRRESVRKFNDENRWKKRGIAVACTSWPADYFGLVYTVFVAIYHFDGSVSVTHGGVEMGQGINTKVAQAVSSTFKIPLHKISIKQTNTLTSSNEAFTGLSINAESSCYAAIQACNVLLKNMQPIKEKLGQDASWEKIVTESFNARIQLSTYYQHSPSDVVKPYLTNGVIVNEVEVDILTGEYKVVRVDLMEDIGKSLNPLLDIGQMEGAYVMGQGYWTTEKKLHDHYTGQLLTNRSWYYKPPESRDIPQDFRMTIMDGGNNPLGVLGSKAISEPPICSSVSVLFALKNAIYAARRNVDHMEWFQLNGPVTVPDIVLHSLTSSSNFSLY